MNGELIKRAMRAKGYLVFGDESKGYDLNLFGIRSKNRRANRFDDLVGFMYLENGRWICYVFPATTDPGSYWLEEPGRVDGTAILVPGQYRGAYKVGTHKGYAALQQQKPVKVYRDADRDEILDMDPATIQEGLFGINIHRAHATHASPLVNKWSAGCQVLADPIHFGFILATAKEAVSRWGNSLTYTLLEAEDVEAVISDAVHEKLEVNP